MLPAGRLVLLASMAAISSSTPTAWAFKSSGRRLIRICRDAVPFKRTWPTPGMAWKRFETSWSARVDRSRSECALAVSATCATGRAFSPSKRTMNGSLASLGKRGRTCATLSRRSCMARSILVDSSKSMYAGAAFPRVGAQRLDAADGVDRLFDRPGDVVLDRFRRRARIQHLDGRAGNVDIGHRLQPQAAIRGQAQHDDRHHHHGGEDRILDTGFSDPHGCHPFPPAWPTCWRPRWPAA